MNSFLIFFLISFHFFLFSSGYLSLSFSLSFSSFFIFSHVFLLIIERKYSLNFPDMEIMYISHFFKKKMGIDRRDAIDRKWPRKRTNLPAFSSRLWPTKPLVLYQKNEDVVAGNCPLLHLLVWTYREVRETQTLMLTAS